MRRPRSSWWASTRSFQRLMMAARCLAGVLRQAGKAACAASSAARASAAPESGTSVISAPVAGSVTARRVAGAAGVAVAVVHWPAMKLALRSSSGRVRVSGMESVDAGVVRGGSAHDAQVPGHELMVAQAQGLALGGLAAGVPQDLREDALPHLGHAAFAVHDQAAVDVHVFLQAPVHG